MPARSIGRTRNDEDSCHFVAGEFSCAHTCAHSIDSRTRIARAAVTGIESGFCFHNNRSSLRGAFSDVIPRDQAHTHRERERERESRQSARRIHFPLLFRGVPERHARFSSRCQLRAARVRVKQIDGVKFTPRCFVAASRSRCRIARVSCRNRHSRFFCNALTISNQWPSGDGAVSLSSSSIKGPPSRDARPR